MENMSFLAVDNSLTPPVLYSFWHDRDTGELNLTIVENPSTDEGLMADYMISHSEVQDFIVKYLNTQE